MDVRGCGLELGTRANELNARGKVLAGRLSGKVLAYAVVYSLLRVSDRIKLYGGYSPGVGGGE